MGIERFSEEEMAEAFEGLNTGKGLEMDGVYPGAVKALHRMEPDYRGKFLKGDRRGENLKRKK